MKPLFKAAVAAFFFVPLLSACAAAPQLAGEPAVMPLSVARSADISPDERWLAKVDAAIHGDRLLLIDQPNGATWEIGNLPAGELRGVTWLGAEVLAIHAGGRVSAVKIHATRTRLERVEFVAIAQTAKQFSRQMARDKANYNPLRQGMSAHAISARGTALRSVAKRK